MRKIVPPEILPSSKQSIAKDMSDFQVVSLARQGNRKAFEQLYRKRNRRFYPLCLRRIGNSAIDEELTQEAFLHVFRKIHTFHGESAFSTWMHRLSANVVRGIRKKGPAYREWSEIFEP
jgi:RNA polymerase sigma-70 factor, ECF subfamily